MPFSSSDGLSMRIRTLKLSPGLFIKLLQGKSSCVASNLPTDAELVDLKFDLLSNQILAVIRSESFDDVAELCSTPEFPLTLAETARTVPPPATLSPKQEAKPTAAMRLEAPSSNKTVPKPSSYTGRIEEEFSPDQRKLLSFKLEGDCVIVKPTHFLKAEWDDINEIVRSLGGKWIKGDIISYWAVPLQQ
jgi:hypothetical protein